MTSREKLQRQLNNLEPDEDGYLITFASTERDYHGLERIRIEKSKFDSATSVHYTKREEYDENGNRISQSSQSISSSHPATPTFSIGNRELVYTIPPSFPTPNFSNLYTDWEFPADGPSFPLYLYTSSTPKCKAKNKKHPLTNIFK
jgi:hypothetical protein